MPRLLYFEMRGRAEPIRLFLHATRTAFDDHRVVTREQWAELRPTLPFRALPVYESDGSRLCESHAILRHLGRTLAPERRSPSEIAALDVAQEAIAESQEDLWRFNWQVDYYDALESYATSTLDERLGNLERWLLRDGRRSADWMGESFSYVDCLAFGYLDEIDAFFPRVLAKFENLAALRSRVGSRPGIEAYLRSPARPLVFGMGMMGPKVDPRMDASRDGTFANPWAEAIDLEAVRARQRRLI